MWLAIFDGFTTHLHPSAIIAPPAWECNQFCFHGWSGEPDALLRDEVMCITAGELCEAENELFRAVPQFGQATRFRERE
jgi:hypothetical protein